MQTCRLRKKEYNVKNKFIHIPSSKNSALAILSAILLTKGIFSISNLAKYADINVMLNLLKQCNIFVHSTDLSDIFDTNQMEIPSEFIDCEKIRASYYLMGVTVYSKKQIKFTLPGGCKLGSTDRKIDEHTRLFEFMGCSITENNRDLILDSNKYQDNFSGEFTFKIKSIGATVNAILSTVKGSGYIVFHNIEFDPIIMNLVNFLNQCGAEINLRPKENCMIIKRTNNLFASNITINPDPIISGTYIIFIALLENSMDFILGPIKKTDLGNFIELIKSIGIVLIEYSNDYYKIDCSKDHYQNIFVQTASYPAIYTDLQPFISIYLYHKKISSQVTDIVMPDRYQYALELNKIGYYFRIKENSLIIEPNDILISMKKCQIGCRDLRGSMAILMATSLGILNNNYGEVIIENYDQIQRGYLHIVELLKMLDIECIIQNKIVPKGNGLAKICSLGIGGEIEHYFEAKTYEQLIKIVHKCLEEKIPYRVIGSGTNIYFKNDFYQGAIIKNSVEFIMPVNHMPVDKNCAYFLVSSGMLLDSMVNHLAENSYDLSSMAGIPGTIGGAIYGNAGAYGCEIKDIIRFATVMTPTGKIVNFYIEDFQFGYRSSILSKQLGYVIISAIFAIPNGNKEEIISKINHIKNLRNSKLPINEATAGSFFKNINLKTAKIPSGYLIGKLKEKININNDTAITLYEKHNNVIINQGNASYHDLESFVENLRREMMYHYGIWLENEVHCIQQSELHSLH